MLITVAGAEGFRRAGLAWSALHGLVPAIPGVHMAVSLLVGGVQGELFASSNPLPDAWHFIPGPIPTGVALSFSCCSYFCEA